MAVDGLYQKENYTPEVWDVLQRQKENYLGTVKRVEYAGTTGQVIVYEDGTFVAQRAVIDYDNEPTIEPNGKLAAYELHQLGLIDRAQYIAQLQHEQTLREQHERELYRMLKEKYDQKK